MRRSGGGLIEGIVELAVALALLAVLLWFVYWAWVNYWPLIVGGAVIIAAVLVFVRWVQHRGGGW